MKILHNQLDEHPRGCACPQLPARTNPAQVVNPALLSLQHHISFHDVFCVRCMTGSLTQSPNVLPQQKLLGKDLARAARRNSTRNFRSASSFRCQCKHLELGIWDEHWQCIAPQHGSRRHHSGSGMQQSLTGLLMDLRMQPLLEARIHGRSFPPDEHGNTCS